MPKIWIISGENGSGGFQKKLLLEAHELIRILVPTVSKFACLYASMIYFSQSRDCQALDI